MNEVIHRHFSLSTRHGLIMVFGVLLCAYFSYHLVQGNRSLLRYMQLNSQISAQQETLAFKQQERAAIEEKVIMMRPETLNPDLLEERIQSVLGYVGPDDYILSTGD